MQDSKIKLSIIILNYNTDGLLINCLNSLIKTGFHDNWEILIVDNNSTLDCLIKIKNYLSKLKQEKINIKIKLIENLKNLGYASGNNIGIQKSKGEYLLLLNSDTIAKTENIDLIMKYMEDNPLVGVITCRVELEDGRLDPACHRGFPTPWVSFCYYLGLEKLFPKSKIFSGYHLGYLPIDKIHEIDSPTGAFYLLRKKIIDSVGLLDERFFMYGEDLDWSYRIKNNGWKIMFFPFTKIIHLKKRSGRWSGNKNLRIETNSYFYETMKLFYQKHYSKKYPKILLWLIFSTINIKKFISRYF